MTRSRFTALALAGLIAGAPDAMAFVTPTPSGPDGVVAPAAARSVRIARGAKAAALDAGPAWRGFRARYAGWSAQWNALTDTPHRAWGPSIALGGPVRDAAAADRAVRGFVNAHSDLFGAPTLATAGVVRAGAWWHVRYRQTIAGLPVLFSDWEFRVHANGRLALFGADVHDPARAGAATPRIARFAARTAAAGGLDLAPGGFAVEDGALAWMPWTGAAGAELRLVWEQTVVAEDPPARWLTYVDARTGEVLGRTNLVRWMIDGTVTGLVHLRTPDDTLTAAAFPHLRVFAGAEGAVTDATGRYTIPASGAVTVIDSLVGLWCDVNNLQPPPGRFTAAVTAPATVDIRWDDANAHVAERDAYFHVTAAHDWLRAIDPEFTGMDRAVRARVNFAGACNAAWDGIGLVLFRASALCRNTATIPDVIHHEYAHGVNDRVYFHAGAGLMINPALHEALADATAAFMQDDPRAGRGFFGPGTWVRRLDETKRWPEDARLDPHETALVLAGALWDLREAIGLETAARLAHFARWGAPDDRDDGIAMSEYFLEVLIADDDDGDLANGTPHSGAIVAAFDAHGIGTGFFLAIDPEPVGDASDPGAIPFAARIVSTAPLGALAPESPRLHWSVNGGAFQAMPMTPAGADRWTATIANPGPAIVRWYVAAENTHGARATDPPAAPAHDVHQFLAGPAFPLLARTMEADPGWATFAPGDDATTGRWTRVNPHGTLIDFVQIQPEEDHGPGGQTVCYVTGQHELEQDVGWSDVDGGTTSLVTERFDALAGGRFPVIEYWRWFSNQYGGAPYTDPWRTWLSNDDGATWALVEETTTPHNAWRRVLVFVESVLPPTRTMRMKFVATDQGEPSLVEAGVDDFRVLAYPADGPVDPSTPLALLPAVPNPSSGHAMLRFGLPAAGRATLRVFDVHGRAVRTLVDRALEPGTLAVVWDGRDDQGRRVTNGPYFVRLTHGGAEALQKIVRVE